MLEPLVLSIPYGLEGTRFEYVLTVEFPEEVREQLRVDPKKHIAFRHESARGK